MVIPPLDPGCYVGWAFTISHAQGGGSEWCFQEVQCCLYPGNKRREVIGRRSMKGVALDAIAWACNHTQELGYPLKVKGKDKVADDC